MDSFFYDCPDLGESLEEGDVFASEFDGSGGAVSVACAGGADLVGTACRSMIGTTRTLIGMRLLPSA